LYPKLLGLPKQILKIRNPNRKRMADLNLTVNEILAIAFLIKSKILLISIKFLEKKTLLKIHQNSNFLARRNQFPDINPKMKRQKNSHF